MRKAGESANSTNKELRLRVSRPAKLIGHSETRTLAELAFSETGNVRGCHKADDDYPPRTRLRKLSSGSTGYCLLYSRSCGSTYM
jgi:hypothetical protein